MEAVFAAWRRGETPVVHIVSLDTPRRRRGVRQCAIEAGEVVVRGQMVASNSETCEDNVWWVRLHSNELVACLRSPTGTLHELSLHMCHLIWGHLPTRTLSPNVRRLPTGTNVPRVPARALRWSKARAPRGGGACSQAPPPSEPAARSLDHGGGGRRRLRGRGF